MSISYNKYSLKIVNSNDISKKKILIPEFQRLLDKEHFEEMYKYQVKHYDQYKEFFFTNPITLCILDKQEYIIDGQHRLQCIKKLNDNKYPVFNIYIITVNVDDEKEMLDKYTAINKNKPVQIFTNMNLYKIFYKKIEEHMTVNYKNYFSNSCSPVTPNFNIHHLNEYLDQHNISQKINHNYELFIMHIEKLNQFYKDNIQEVSKNFKNNIDNKLQKSRDIQSNFLLLSLYKKFEWVDRIMYCIENKIEYTDIQHYPYDFRVKIKKPLKKEVWAKRNNGLLNGNCFCCSKKIHYDDFECGHITSVFYKGETNLSNLEPICSSCNKDMGTKDLHDYKKELLNELH